VAAEWVDIFLRISEVTGSNLIPVTDCTLSRFSPLPPGKCHSSDTAEGTLMNRPPPPLPPAVNIPLSVLPCISLQSLSLAFLTNTCSDKNEITSLTASVLGWLTQVKHGCKKQSECCRRKESNFIIPATHGTYICGLSKTIFLPYEHV